MKKFTTEQINKAANEYCIKKDIQGFKRGVEWATTTKVGESSSPLNASKLFDDNADVCWRTGTMSLDEKYMSKETFERVLKEYQGVDVKYLLHLIDCTWNCAFEDNSVPSTSLAKTIIETANKTYKP